MGFDKSKKFEVDQSSVVGFDLATPVLFFKMSGDKTKQDYLYVKFEQHGMRSFSDIFGHAIDWWNTRENEKDGCNSSRKEKIGAIFYNPSHDPVILSANVSQEDKNETFEYSSSGQRLGCELFVGHKKALDTIALQTATGVQKAQRLNSEALQTATGVQEAQRLNSEDEKNENLRKDKIQGLLNEKDAEIKKLKNEQKDLQEQKENFKKEAEESKEELKTLQKLQKQVAKDMVKNKSSAKQEQVMDKATVIQNEQMKKKVDETKKREEELISAQAELEEEMAKKREEEEKLKEARIAQEEL